MSHVYLKLSVGRRKQVTLETEVKGSTATTLLNQAPPCTDTSHMLCQVSEAHRQPLPHTVPRVPHTIWLGAYSDLFPLQTALLSGADSTDLTAMRMQGSRPC